MTIAYPAFWLAFLMPRASFLEHWKNRHEMTISTEVISQGMSFVTLGLPDWYSSGQTLLNELLVQSEH